MSVIVKTAVIIHWGFLIIEMFFLLEFGICTVLVTSRTRSTDT